MVDINSSLRRFALSADSSASVFNVLIGSAEPRDASTIAKSITFTRDTETGAQRNIRDYSAQVAVSLVNARLYDMVLASLGSADRINTLKTEALEAAESANRLKDEFMSTITHELLTPINGIRLSLSLLKPGVSGEYCDFLDTANDSSQHLLNIIESNVTFVEARRGTIKLKRNPLDFK